MNYEMKEYKPKCKNVYAWQWNGGTEDDAKRFCLATGVEFRRYDLDQQTISGDNGLHAHIGYKTGWVDERVDYTIKPTDFIVEDYGGYLSVKTETDFKNEYSEA